MIYLRSGHKDDWSIRQATVKPAGCSCIVIPRSKIHTLSMRCIQTKLLPQLLWEIDSILNKKAAFHLAFFYPRSSSTTTIFVKLRLPQATAPFPKTQHPFSTSPVEQLNMLQTSQIQTPDGISWYVQHSGTGPHLLLIPSGEGDCTVYDKLASLLSPHFTVTTFDMPCFSRTIAPISFVQDLSPYKIADQIVLLMDELKIEKASVFGISSGGNISLALLEKYDKRVEKLVVHEVPFTVVRGVVEFTDRPASEDDKTIAHFEYVFAEHMNKDKSAWLSLGSEYHGRLKKNYVTWIKHYAGVPSGSNFGVWKEELRGKKDRVFWSVGGLMPMFWFFDNVVFCTQVGIKLEMLDCKHFPQVSIPEVLAGYIRKCLGGS